MIKVDGSIAVISVKNFPIGLHVMYEYLYFPDTPRTSWLKPEIIHWQDNYARAIVLCSPRSQNCAERLLFWSFLSLLIPCLSVWVSVSVPAHETTRLPLDEILWNFIFEDFDKKIEKIGVWLKSHKSFRGTLHEDLCVFIVISSRILLRIKNISEARCSEIQNTHFVYILITNFCELIIIYS